tara:strand:- start:4067 stop:4333 length:267 start_codon:yes stop_codon:yes gene_type:complete
LFNKFKQLRNAIIKTKENKMKYRIKRKTGVLSDLAKRSMKISPTSCHYWELIVDELDFGSFGKVPVIEFFETKKEAEKRIKELKSEDK